jgi:hypothetical protein
MQRNQLSYAVGIAQDCTRKEQTSACPKNVGFAVGDLKKNERIHDFVVFKNCNNAIDERCMNNVYRVLLMHVNGRGHVK